MVTILYITSFIFTETYAAMQEPSPYCHQYL